MNYFYELGDSAPQVAAGDFAKLSEQHFGTTMYGLSAANLLHHLRRFTGDPQALPPQFQNSQLITGPIIQETIAQHVEDNDLARHSLRGALGKMIDLFCLAGKVLRTPRTAGLPPEAFMSKVALIAQMDADGLSDKSKNEIRLAINANVQRQLCTGQPGPNGDIILEGVVRFSRSPPFNTAFQSIAYRTLPCLIDEIPPGLGKPAKRFLQQFD